MPGTHAWTLGFGPWQWLRYGCRWPVGTHGRRALAYVALDNRLTWWCHVQARGRTGRSLADAAYPVQSRLPCMRPVQNGVRGRMLVRQHVESVRGCLGMRAQRVAERTPCCSCAPHQQALPPAGLPTTSPDGGARLQQAPRGTAPRSSRPCIPWCPCQRVACIHHAQQAKRPIKARRPRTTHLCGGHIAPPERHPEHRVQRAEGSHVHSHICACHYCQRDGTS